MVFDQPGFGNFATDPALLRAAEGCEDVRIVESIDANIATLELSGNTKDPNNVFRVDLSYIIPELVTSYCSASRST